MLYCILNESWMQYPTKQQLCHQSLKPPKQDEKDMRDTIRTSRTNS